MELITGDVTNPDEVLGQQLKAGFKLSSSDKSGNIATRDRFVHVTQQTQHPNCTLTDVSP
jgi:hypothetical protein